MHVRRIQAFRLCKQFWGMTRPPLKGRKPQILALPMAGRTKLETRAGFAKEIPPGWTKARPEIAISGHRKMAKPLF